MCLVDYFISTTLIRVFHLIWSWRRCFSHMAKLRSLRIGIRRLSLVFSDTVFGLDVVWFNWMVIGVVHQYAIRTTWLLVNMLLLSFALLFWWSVWLWVVDFGLQLNIWFEVWLTGLSVHLGCNFVEVFPERLPLVVRDIALVCVLNTRLVWHWICRYLRYQWLILQLRMVDGLLVYDLLVLLRHAFTLLIVVQANWNAATCTIEFVDILVDVGFGSNTNTPSGINYSFVQI